MTSDEVVLRRSRPPGSRPRPGPGIVRPPEPVAGPFETWAQLDPTGVVPRLVRLVANLPGVTALERHVVAPLEARLLEIATARARVLFAPAPPAPAPRATPQTALRGIVEDAVDRTPTDSRDQLYVALLDRLVADEVRILAALAEPRAYPVIHVAASRRSQDTPIIRNASTVGTAAGVGVRERTPHFIADLVHLGLARIDAEDPALADGYRQLLAMPDIAAARADAGTRWRRVSIQRRTLRITDFGLELWRAAQPAAVTVTG